MENLPPFPPLSVSFALSTEDIDALQEYSVERGKETAQWSPTSRLIVLFVLMFAMIMMGSAIAKNFSRHQASRRIVRPMTPQNWFQLVAPSATVVIFLVPAYLWMKRLSKKALYNQPSEFFAPRTVTISSDGYREKSQGSEFTREWMAMGEIRDRPGHILFTLPEYNDVEHVYLVPKSAFDSSVESGDFLERARGFRRGARARSVTP